MYKPLGKYICVKDIEAKNVYSEGYSYFRKGKIKDCVKVSNSEFGNYGFHIYMPTENSFNYKDIFKEYFFGYFIPYSDKYILDIIEDKKILGVKYKSKQRNVFCFDKLTSMTLKELHYSIFFYIEEIKRLAPELLVSFTFTICDTLKNLESMSYVLNKDDFIQAINLAKPVFQEMYEVAMDILKKGTDSSDEKEAIRHMLKQFGSEMKVRRDVLNDIKFSDKKI